MHIQAEAPKTAIYNNSSSNDVQTLCLTSIILCNRFSVKLLGEELSYK